MKLSRIIYLLALTFSQGLLAQKMSSQPIKHNVSFGVARSFLSKSTGEKIRRTQLSFSHFGSLPYNFTYEGEFYFIPDFSHQTGKVIVKETHFALNAYLGYSFSYLFRFRPAFGFGGVLEKYDQKIDEASRTDLIPGIQVIAKLNVDYAVTDNFEVSVEGGTRYRIHWNTFDGFLGIRLAYNL